MSALHHLGEDGISGNSSALPGRKSCYRHLHLHLRQRWLKHSDFAPNSLLINIYLQVQPAQYFAATFAFRPLCFQDFTSRGRGGGGAPLLKFMD